MKRNEYLLLIMIILLAPMCKDRFDPHLRYPATGYLVVEGFLNSGQGPTEIRLSRSVPLDDSEAVKPEAGARLEVENSKEVIAQLTETGAGIYTYPQLIINYDDLYRLHIYTAGGAQYYSDFIKPVHAPPIDSVAWSWPESGVEISVNSHDPANATHYYTWRWDETWEIDATFNPVVKYVLDRGRAVGTTYINADHSPDLSGARCWHYGHSNTILTGSSIKLSEDVIHSPIRVIPNNSDKLSVLYYIKVFQHGLSAGGYDFMQRMKKNTEETGSIFDAQPSELNSNIHNVFEPGELVYGYLDVSNQDSAAIFISRGDVPGWGYRDQCTELIIYPSDSPDTLQKYQGYSPIDYTYYLSFKALFVASPPCVDCRLAGSNIKPDYWPR